MGRRANAHPGTRLLSSLPMETVLVIGASRGIGLGFVRSLLDRKVYQVHATARDLATSEDLTALAANPALHLHQLDVVQADSREDFIDKLDRLPLDLVIHNAGIHGPHGLSIGELPEREWQKVLHVDTIAPLLLAQALLPNLNRAGPGRIVFLSSRMGSIDDNESGGSYLYRSAKAGLNAAVRSLAIDLKREGIAVLLLHPGWVRTRMGGATAPLSVEESVRGMLEQIRALDLEHSGRFVDWSGAEIPW